MKDLELFCTCGEALFGPQWQSELARQLDVNLATMRRWATGKFAIPPGIWADLANMLAERQVEIAELEPLLKERASTSQ